MSDSQAQQLSWASNDLKETLQRGNQLPHLFSDVDMADVRHSIAQHEEAIESLDLEMEDHMRIIRQLQHKKQLHLAKIRHCKGMITLAKRLPPEILAAIFEECVRDGWTRTPIVVSGVCSSWRKAALTPTVWAHVYINIDNHDSCKRTQLWLERSQSVPLIIHIEIGKDATRFDHLMAILNEEAGRWKEFSIKSVLLHPVNEILQVFPSILPQLRFINLSVDQEFSTNDPVGETQQLVAFRNAMRNTPHLRSVRLERNLLPTPDMLPSSITHLALALPSRLIQTRHTAATLLGLLEQLTSLETLSIEVPMSSMARQSFDLESAQALEIELPRLRSLTLMGANNTFAILPHMRFPSLTELLLRSSSDVGIEQDEGTAQWLVSFFEAPPHSILTLEIRDLTLPPCTYAQILPYLPSLRVLRLHDSDINDTTLGQMCSPQRLCPSLEVIDLRWCGRLSGPALVGVVHERCHSNEETGLKVILEVTVINCSIKEEDILSLAKLTTCRLIHRGTPDYCYPYGCCDNQRYRRRLRQRLAFHRENQAEYSLILE